MYVKELAKSKTAAKTITYEGPGLKKIVLAAVAKASKLVGSTLGPNGKVVLMERQENLPPYTTKDGITVFNGMAFQNPTAQAVLEAARDSSSKTNVEAGDGPQPLYSKILTPTGFTYMKDIKKGMDICGIHGSIQTVVGVFPKGEKEIYEIEFEGGRVVECCADHLWNVTTSRGIKGVKTTATLSKDYKRTSKTDTRYKYYVPSTFVEFDENAEGMPLDPYLVGVLLGDGSLSGNGSIELSLGKKKEHIISKLQLPKGIEAKISFIVHKHAYRIKLVGTTPDGESMFDIVKSIGLLGTLSKTKHIPKSYLHSSRVSREKLLRGLLDTDGHINTRKRFEYSTISRDLYEDFQFLVQSLGVPVHASTLNRKEGSGYSDTTVYRVIELKGNKYGNKIVRITPTGRTTQMQCIKVSNSDSLYITDNFIVTHNTTTATILAEALIRLGFEYLEKNPRVSTQKVMRELEVTLRDFIVPFIQENSIKIRPDDTQELLRKVALIATNNDVEMTDKVVEGFDMVGHNGNFTILEVPGSSGYAIERIDGFPIPRGFEDSCGRFIEEFINDKGNYRTILDKPKFVLYNGKINDISTILPIMEKVAEASDSAKHGSNSFTPNIVIVAHHFSESVLAILANNFKNPNTINVIPLKTYMTQQTNSPYHFLVDLSAFTGSIVFDPLSKPVESAELQDLGLDTMQSFEFYRFKSLLLGDPDEFLVISRTQELEQQLKGAESQLDSELLQERMALLTGGIAKIKVMGSSESELKEKRHRVEDAIAAIKSALREGVLPGCAKTLLQLHGMIMDADEGVLSDAVKHIMGVAFMQPFKRILENGGCDKEEIMTIAKEMSENEFFYTYDALNHKYGDAIEIGVVDSAAAVMGAIKNSLAVAKMLMGLSGIVVFKRDSGLDMNEAKDFDDEQDEMARAIKRSNEEPWEMPD